MASNDNENKIIKIKWLCRKLLFSQAVACLVQILHNQMVHLLAKPVSILSHSSDTTEEGPKELICKKKTMAVQILTMLLVPSNNIYLKK